MDRARNVCKAFGPDSMASELWAEVVALSDGWTRYLKLDQRLYRAAREVGTTDEQYQAIKRAS